MDYNDHQWIYYQFYWIDYNDIYPQSDPMEGQQIVWDGEPDFSLCNYHPSRRLQIWKHTFQEYFTQLDLDVCHSIHLERQTCGNLGRVRLSVTDGREYWISYTEIGWISLRSLKTRTISGLAQSLYAGFKSWYLTDQFWYETLEYS